jgi:hypothetical protein
LESIAVKVRRLTADFARFALSVADAIRKEDRKDLQTSRSKSASATEQIKSPHPPERSP